MSVTTVDQVRAALQSANAKASSTWVLIAKLTADERAVGKAAALAALSDNDFLGRVLAQVPNCYESEGGDMAKLAKAAHPSELQKKCMAKSINWGDLIAKLQAALQVADEVVVPAVEEIISVLLNHLPAAPKKCATAGATCPSDHCTCCHATLASALQTAYLAASCCGQCPDGPEA